MGAATTSYEADVKPRLEEISSWCAEGLTDAEIAILLGVGATTLSRYKILHEELADTMRTHKAVFNATVVRALAKAATGFEFVEETQELAPTGKKNEDGSLELAFMVTKRVKKTCPPNVAASTYWLNNRESADWKDQRHIKVDEDKKLTIVLPEGLLLAPTPKSLDYTPPEDTTQVPGEEVIDVQEIPNP